MARAKRSKTDSFKSDLERRASKILKHQYETATFPYVTTHVYTADFVDFNNKIVYETKGRFREGEMQKYLAVREQHRDWKFRFIFQNPLCPMPRVRRRKDGTIYKMRDWADEHKFEWCSINNIPEDWRAKDTSARL